MLANFPKERWDKIREVYSKWWNHTLERPVINVSLNDADPGIEKPERTMYHNLYLYPSRIPAETIAKHWQYQVLSKKFLGDSFPICLPDYGPGVNAAFLGCKAIVSPEIGTVWFEQENYLTPDKLHFEFNPEEPVYRRIKSVYEAASSLFDGSVVLGMTHLNNGIDIPARFLGTTETNMYFYDDPENIKRLTWENHNLMYDYIDKFAEAMGTVPGYTCWGDMYADEPWMGLQSDFSAMISPKHFEEFVLPELKACVKRSKYNYYHMDGPGQLPHLDMLCEIPELKCIQWVPGCTGAPPETKWPEVYRKISQAGKNIWLTGPIEYIEVIADQIGTGKGIYWSGVYSIGEEERILKILEKFKVI